MNTPFEIVIADRKIGRRHPVYIVAEMSANHNQEFNHAVDILYAAKEVGADAVKLQTYTADTITIKSDEPCFQIQGGTAWDGRTLYELYQEAYTPWEWQPNLKKIADKIGIDLFSSAFDATAVDFLEVMGVPVHKISSFELVDIPLIQKMAATRKPLIMSTGMANDEEIGEAVVAAQAAGARGIVLLKCTSAYPARPEEMNLRAIPYLEKTYGVPVGLSDHTLGIAVPVAAVALGACLIEKHFILSRESGGADSHFSLEPDEFREMVQAVRTVEKAVGAVRSTLAVREETMRMFRRSLFVVKDVKAGEVLTEDCVRSIRPGAGLAPKYLPQVIGCKATRDLTRGMPLDWDMFKKQGEIE